MSCNIATGNFDIGLSLLLPAAPCRTLFQTFIGYVRITSGNSDAVFHYLADITANYAFFSVCMPFSYTCSFIQ